MKLIYTAFQSDRESAANYHYLNGIGPRQSRSMTAGEMRAGQRDEDPLVQVFAKHRILILARALELLQRAQHLANRASTADWHEDRNIMTAVHLSGDIGTFIKEVVEP